MPLRAQFCSSQCPLQSDLQPAAPPSDRKSIAKVDKSKPTPASKEKQVKDSAEKDTKKSATKSTKKSPASAAKPASSKSEVRMMLVFVRMYLL